MVYGSGGHMTLARAGWRALDVVADYGDLYGGPIAVAPGAAYVAESSCGIAVLRSENRLAAALGR